MRPTKSPSWRHHGATLPAGLVPVGPFFFDSLASHASKFCPREPLNTTHKISEAL